MNRLNPEKLYVSFRPGTTPIQPIIPRRYTLTHSDITAELFLTIGPNYAYEKIGPSRDEVLAAWQTTNNSYVLSVYLYVGGEQFGKATAAIRYKIFKQELSLALEAIRYGDRYFFETHPKLDTAPIWVYFNSLYPPFNHVKYWGTLVEYA